MLCEERVRKLSTRCDGAWSVMLLNVVFRVSNHVGPKQEDTNVMKIEDVHGISTRNLDVIFFLRFEET